MSSNQPRLRPADHHGQGGSPSPPPAPASAHLGFDLLTQLAKAKGADPNPVVSPASLTAALPHAQIHDSQNSMSALVRRFASTGPGIAAHRPACFPRPLDRSRSEAESGAAPPASAPCISIRAAARSRLDQLKQAGVQAEIRDPADAKTIDDINALVKDRTKAPGPLLDEPLRKGGLVVLNALHFKDDWRMAFDPAHTAPDGFPWAQGRCRQGGDDAERQRQVGLSQEGRFIAVGLLYKTKGFDLILLTTQTGCARDSPPVSGWLTGEGFGESEGPRATRGSATSARAIATRSRSPSG